MWLTSKELQPLWVPALEAGKLDSSFDGLPNIEGMNLAMTAAGSPAVVGRLLELIKSKKLGSDREFNAMKVVASLGSPRETGQALDLILEADRDPFQRLNLLTALTSARRPGGDLARIRPLLDETTHPLLRVGAIAAAGVWKVEALLGDLVAAAQFEQSFRPPDGRRRAWRAGKSGEPRGVVEARGRGRAR